MAANTNPIYPKAADPSTNGTTGMPGTLTTAAADYTGISGSNALIHTAGPNGAIIRRLRCKAIGTNTASVLRVYLNNGATPGTATTNVLIGEVSLPGTTAIATAATADVDYPMDWRIPAGWRVYVGLGTTVAAGWVITCDAGQY
jgi:hypothetical protein